MSTRTATASGTPQGTAGSGAEPLIVDFPSGIPGFETCHRFVLVASSEIAPLMCLRSVDPPEASFLVVEPQLIDPSYDLTLREFERVRLGGGDDPLLWLAIVSVVDGEAFVNLRAPIVINARRMTGCQFIRDEIDYPVSYPLGRA
jgi:flagellar assembly factor FliW